MKEAEIMVVCNHEGILQTIIRLIGNNAGWNAIGLTDTQKAVQLLDEKEYDLILIGSGLAEADEEKLKAASANGEKAIPVVKHYGGGSGLLFGEIHHALAGRINII